MNITYTRVSFDEAKKIMDKNKDCVILDVRTDEEFFTGHAEGATNLDIDLIDADSAAAVIPSKCTPTLVYCKTGERARLACEALVALGYTEIYDIGSLVEWPYGISFD